MQGNNQSDNNEILSTKQNDNKNHNSSKIKSYLPVLIAFSIVIGIFIGNKLIPSQQSAQQAAFNINKPSKINSILRLLEENYVKKMSVDSIEEVIIPQILKFFDPHTSYFPPKINVEAHESLNGNFEGIGVQFNIQEDTILIINTISGGPSEKIGVLAGDRIVTINDSLFAGIGITNDDVIKNLKGAKGTKVKIGIKRKNIKDLIFFDIIRDKIPLYSVDVSYMLNNKTGYIKISQFAGTTYSEFMEAAAKLKQAGMSRLVLDLRDNGGGYIDAAVNITDEFLPKGKMIVYTKGDFREQVNYKATDNDFLIDTELIILINSWSASASEIVAGAVQDNDRGTIIGRRSFGKGLVQEEFGFSDNSGIRITTAKYYTPLGRSIQKPYKNGFESYYSDIYHRAEDGELVNENNATYTDSVKYLTEKGKVLYGGGGIMPDIFVPIDTVSFTEFFKQITSKGLIYSFALSYSDNNRETLKKLKSAEEINAYLDKINILNQFLKYSEQKGVISNTHDLKLSKKVINTQLKAYIARNIIDNEGYFPIIRTIDDDLQKAVEIIQK